MLVLLNNPFFILGIYSNSKIRERTSHITKIKAYSNVGKNTSFELDFPTCLTSPERNEKTVEESLSKINNAKDCFCSYLFWLSNSNSIDETAINHAKSGNFDKAIEILSKQKKATSTINLSVIYYLTKQDTKAIEKAFEVINNPEYLNSFIEFFNSSSGHNTSITSSEASSLYLESLLQDYDTERLYNILTSLEGEHSEQISYLNVKRSASFTDAIDLILAKEKYEQDSKHPLSFYIDKARNIISKTDQLRKDLLNIVGEDSYIAQECCSKIAGMIRECAMNALSNDVESENEINDIENLLKTACNLSLSYIFKAKCEDDFNTLNGHRQRLEDKEMIDAYGHLCNQYKQNFNSKIDYIAERTSEFICYAIPLIEKMTVRVGYEIGQKLYDSMVITVINNIHEAFENLSKNSGTYNFITKLAEGLKLFSGQLNFLCDRYNQGKLYLSREIANALFSNQNQLVEVISTYESKSFEFKMAIKNSYEFSAWPLRDFDFNYCENDYLSIYRNEIKMEKQRRKQEEEERKKKQLEKANKPVPNAPSSNNNFNSSNGGCYIATLVYGDYDHPKVKVLRHFRDNVLLKSNLGKKFVKFYYKYSPGWVQRLKNKNRINLCIKSILNCFVYIYRKINNV